MPKEKPATSSPGRVFPGDTLVVVQDVDCAPEAQETQARAILEGALANVELRMELDGQVERRPLGFNAETASRRMFIPYRVTTCPATALAICKSRGLLASKLDAMTADAREVLLALTLPKRELDN
jgi:hypothetical protein